MNPGLCIVGCGAFAKTFARGVTPMRDRVDLFFASRDLSKAREYSRQFNGAGAFGSYEAAAADPGVAAMYLCTPHHLHLEHVRLAAQAGKHILVEKPIAPTISEGRQIIDAARQANVKLMVAENYRFMPPVRECKRLVENGTIGELRLIQLHEEAQFSPSTWRNRRELNGGGILIDGGIHKIHFLRYLMGEPTSIYAAALPKVLDDHEGEDGIIMIARWESGTVGMINHSWAAPRQPSPRLVSVSGSKGRLALVAGESWLRIEGPASEQTLSWPEDNFGLTAMLQEFLDSIQENREPETSGEEGLNDLELVLKAYQSIEQSISIPLP